MKNPIYEEFGIRAAYIGDDVIHVHFKDGDISSFYDDGTFAHNNVERQLLNSDLELLPVRLCTQAIEMIEGKRREQV